MKIALFIFVPERRITRRKKASRLKGSECGMIVSMPHSELSELASGSGWRILTGSNSFGVFYQHFH